MSRIQRGTLRLQLFPVLPGRLLLASLQSTPRVKPGHEQTIRSHFASSSEPNHLVSPVRCMAMSDDEYVAFCPHGDLCKKNNKALRSRLSEAKCHDFVRNHLETSCYHKMKHDEATKWSAAGVYKYVVGEPDLLPMYPGIVANTEKEKKVRLAAKAKAEERLAKIRKVAKFADVSAQAGLDEEPIAPACGSRSRSRSTRRSRSRDQETNLADVKQDVSDQEKILRISRKR